MANWWKCQIVAEDNILSSSEKGEILYAKKGETSITLFNGVTEISIPQTAMKNIKLLCKATREETSYLEINYQLLQNRKATRYSNMAVN